MLIICYKLGCVDVSAWNFDTSTAFETFPFVLEYAGGVNVSGASYFCFCTSLYERLSLKCASFLIMSVKWSWTPYK